MSIHYDKLTFTKEQVELDAETLNGIVEEDDMFYSIVFPFGNDKFEFKYENEKNVHTHSHPVPILRARSSA